MKELVELAIAINVLFLSFSTNDRFNTLEQQNKDLIVKVNSLLKIKNQ